METIPDLVGYPINAAIKVLEDHNLEITIIESYGKVKEQTEDARVIRQTSINNNKIELIISFF
ncbi:PASTA domain-containing protein [Alkaliphilus hydrothermalis]|uniref:Beta-lactam-binding protein with PASTA domain n=1 Tax=Alkaliphilus hydrothermalis TaxID=1482730 RepID=A0ABS2NL77_9FIRM|nr:PASTA domain-containing protein [Alkaliphilus hydrothermalis]MBM7613694.1 beta-lactam-binding protein with PASTA domain [Alkaliphilus hydrothermalis]